MNGGRFCVLNTKYKIAPLKENILQQRSRVNDLPRLLCLKRQYWHSSGEISNSTFTFHWFIKSHHLQPGINFCWSSFVIGTRIRFCNSTRFLANIVNFIKKVRTCCLSFGSEIYFACSVRCKKINSPHRREIALQGGRKILDLEKKEKWRIFVFIMKGA